MTDDRACEVYKKRKHLYKKVSLCLNLLKSYLTHITYSLLKNLWRKTLWMISDDLSNLAS